MRTMNEILRDAEILFAFLADTEETSDKADIVLAMGGSDLRVADTAASAFFERHAGWLICTGGFGKDTAGILPYPESVMYAKRCVESGVPEARILIEDRSTNSGENFRYGKALLEERGIFPRTGVIASKPYMAKRAWAAAAKQWPEVRWSVACQRIGFMEYLEQENDAEKVLNLMVGDLQRLRVYAGTFQEPMPVPDAIWTVYERLVMDGYDKYVIHNA